MLRLLIDVNYLCHRAFHTTGQLSFDGVYTGVVFGVLRAVESEVELHNPDVVVFAFDCIGPTLRQGLYAGYKETRRKRREAETESEQDDRRGLHRQIRDLHDFILPDLGYRNVFRRDGYEADDIIADVAYGTTDFDQSLIISADKDLWQCIRSNVWCRNPTTGKVTTLESFRVDWGIEPARWVLVKALAGCSTDDVLGIPGVGEKTAVRYLVGTLKSSSKAYRKIVQSDELILANMCLVTLPFEPIDDLGLRPDELTEQKCADVYGRLGFQDSRTLRAVGVRPKSKQHKVGFGFS